MFRVLNSRLALCADYVTAFHVYAPSTPRSKAINPVTFKKRFSNFGLNYNHNDGKFTASHDGIYYFAARIHNVYHKNAIIFVNLYHYNPATRQRVVLASATSYSWLQPGKTYARHFEGSLQALVYLKSQDKVWIGTFSLEQILLDKGSYFIGFMLAKL